MRGANALLLIAALTVAPSSLAPTPAQACAPATRAGEEVHIVDESAVIHWDPATRVEQFVRYARFDTTSSDFGFLVPTPTQPVLDAASGALFTTLDDMIKPEEREETHTSVVPTVSCLYFTMRSARSTSSVATPRTAVAQSVRVLSAQMVAGYDAVVLEADNAEALAQWLTTRGYANSPTLQRWLAPYVAQRWKITAFRVAKANPSDGSPPATAPVRMTFTTDRPFYPYREPENQRANTGRGRTLRVHVLSTERMRGTLGDAGRWPGEVQYANAPRDLPSRLGTMLGVAVPAGTWLTSFDDRSSPRPGTDEVYFSSSPDRAPVTPPPIVHTRTNEIPIPLDWVGLVALTAWIVWRRVRKAKARSSTTTP